MIKSHVHANVENDLREKLKITISSSHKETTPGAKKMHTNNVKSLKEKFYAYKVDPFGDGVARNISTGMEIDTKGIEGLLKTPEV